MTRFLHWLLCSCIGSDSDASDGNDLPEARNKSRRAGRKPKAVKKPRETSDNRPLSQGDNRDDKTPPPTTLEWISGDKKEVTVIKWKLKDFPTLCEMRDLLKTEVCLFSTGYSLQYPTRWCFNIQRMKQDNNIGLFLERLAPLTIEGPGCLTPPPGPSGESNPEVVAPSSIESNAQNCSEGVHIQYQCNIRKASDGDIWIRQKTCIPKFKVGQRLGFRRLFTLEDLKAADSELNKAPLLSPEDDYSLNIEIIFTLYLQTNHSSTQSETDLREKLYFQSSEKFHVKLLQQELNTLLKSGVHADTIMLLEDDDNSSFSVHKAILAARSPMFAGMFQSGMRECQTGIIRVKDISAKVMECILSYMYTGVMDNLNWNNVKEVEEVIYAADKFLLIGLRELCDKMMFSGCNNENALELLTIAQTHSLNVGVSDVNSYLKRHANEIFIPGVVP